MFAISLTLREVRCRKLNITKRVDVAMINNYRICLMCHSENNMQLSRKTGAVGKSLQHSVSCPGKY